MARNQPNPVVFEGMEVGLKMFRWVVALMLAFFLGSGIQSVSYEGVGLLLRFGRLHAPPQEPGLLLALPYPVDRVIQVPTRHEGEVEIKEFWRQISPVAGRDEIDPTLEGYCLTGDQNIVQALLVAKYRITDPVRYQLHFANPEGLLHEAVLAAATRTVAAWKVDEVLWLQQAPADRPQVAASLAQAVQSDAQRRLDALDAGIRIVAIEFKEIHPPRHVIAAFRDVQSAKIEMDKVQREAEGFRDSEIPKAKAEMNSMIQNAVAYQNSLKAKASEELAIFRELHVEYRKNPELVRQRILMETFEEILGSVGKLRFVAPQSRVIVSD
jgi:membrane protease subunit HflK